MKQFLTQKELPVSERPYEKCERFGPEFLSDAELLAVLIRSGSKSERAVELAIRILNHPGQKHGLTGLYHFTQTELRKIKGIGKVKAAQIACAVELSKRLNSAVPAQKEEFNCPETIAAAYMEQLCHKRTEEILLLFLDTKGRKIADEVISKGTVNNAILDPREVLTAALRHEAVYLVVLHNHPSGIATPSEADIRVTRRLYEACEIVGIGLRDHIVIGEHCYFSMRERGLFDS